jgi:endonuclease G
LLEGKSSSEIFTLDKTMKLWKKSWRWQLIGSLVFFCIIASSTISLGQLNFGSAHLLVMGNPSDATTEVTNADNYLILRPQYALSYNRSKAIPNWVSWQLNNSWLGTRPRPPFMPDTTLPRGWYRVLPGDYSGSGFDRGHMAPAADRNKTPADSVAVFLMTNIIPQAPDNNQGPWADLENYSRDLVKQGKELYIIAGGSGTGGTGTNGAKTTIASGKVAVPANTWKIIVVLDRPGLGWRGVTNTTRVIAVTMPNQQGIKAQDWKSFRKSVDEIEAQTGYDFLRNVPTPIQAVIEAKVDAQ